MGKMKRRIAAITMAATIIVTPLGMAVAHAQFWAQKEKEAWSQQECARMLRDSPWAAQVLGVMDPNEISLVGPARPRITYVVQLWSAKPVRMAMARNVQFEPRFMNLSPEERQRMYTDAKGFIEENYDDAVVAHIVYGANLTSTDKDLRFFWGSQKPETIKERVTLAGPRGRVELKEVTGKFNGRDEMEITFPRRVAGKTLLEPGDESFRLEIVCPRFKNVPAHRATVEFSAAKMMFGGKLEY
jgi:hypothetical protein